MLREHQRPYSRRRWSESPADRGHACRVCALKNGVRPLPVYTFFKKDKNSRTLKGEQRHIAVRRPARKHSSVALMRRPCNRVDCQLRATDNRLPIRPKIQTRRLVHSMLVYDIPFAQRHFLPYQHLNVTTRDSSATVRSYEHEARTLPNLGCDHATCHTGPLCLQVREPPHATWQAEGEWGYVSLRQHRTA